MGDKQNYNNQQFLQMQQNAGPSNHMGFAAPPSYDQATSGQQTMTGHVASAPSDIPNQSPVYHQQYMSSSTCVYTPVQNAPPPVRVYATAQGAPLPNQATVLTQQPVVIVQQQYLPLGPEPVFVTCPSCHVQKLTRIDYEPSSRTHLMAALLCILGLWCCVCLPYCAGSCMNANHYCGNCNKFLGTYGNNL